MLIISRNHDMYTYADPLGDVSEQKVWPKDTSGMAIASLVLGLLSFCLMLLTGIPAIILGALSLRANKRSDGDMRNSALRLEFTIERLNCYVPVFQRKLVH
jgi:hypothetical protein